LQHEKSGGRRIVFVECQVLEAAAAPFLGGDVFRLRNQKLNDIGGKFKRKRERNQSK
jgi:hypothetical protein